jgi:hypothetical protein
MTIGKTDNSTLSGWSAVGALATVTATKVLTALVMSFPLSWLASYVFGGGVALRALFGPDGLSYWRCVGLFAIWHVARIRIKYSGPAQIEIQGDR